MPFVYYCTQHWIDPRDERVHEWYVIHESDTQLDDAQLQEEVASQVALGLDISELAGLGILDTRELIIGEANCVEVEQQ